ncbi:MAG: PKD domain-containing protein [Bacteroidetes bacterium]|nr:MAG: PKD domain-containing protein [Bacteroidota bacterium]
MQMLSYKLLTHPNLYLAWRAVSARIQQGSRMLLAAFLVTFALPTQGQEVRYDNYESTVAGVWRYEIVRPEYRFDWENLRTLYNIGPEVAINPSMGVTQIQSAIQNAPNGSRIVFEPGTYYMSNTLKIERGDIRLETPGTVVFSFNFSPSWNRYGLWIAGRGGTGEKTYITDGIMDEHSYTVSVQDGSIFGVGDWVRVSAYARAQTYSSGNQVTLPNGERLHRMAVIAKVVGKTGNTLELDRKPAFPTGWIEYPQYADVEKWELIENVVINGDFRLSYTDMLGYAAGGVNANPLSTWATYTHLVAALKIQNIRYVGLFGLRTENSPSTSIWMNSCVDMYLDNCGAYGAHNRGDGGQGYAVLHGGCTNVRARNWHDERMRHSWATSLTTSSVALDVEIDYTESNPEFSHGGFDRLQSFRVQTISPHQDGEKYRLFDHREVKVLSRNAGWVGTIQGMKPYGQYDNSLRTLPGTNCDYNFGPVASTHKPYFRDAPNATYESTIGDVGFNTTYIIAMGLGNRYVINPGTHIFNHSNPRGSVFFMAPNAGGQATHLTVNGFLTNAARARRADLIVIPADANVSSFADLTISGSANATISWGNSTIVLNGVNPAAISEEHVKVMSVERMDRIHHRMGVQYTLKEDDPYIVKTEVLWDPNNPQIRQTWNRPVSLTGQGLGQWLTAEGNLITSINSSNTLIDGNTVTYSIPNVTLGEVVKPRIDPGFFADSYGNAAQGLYDWHEDVVYSGAFFSEAVEMAPAANPPSMSPVAVINFTRNTLYAPASVSFEGAGSYDPDGNIVEYIWDLGDGTTETAITFQHTYQNPGTYPVTLEVRDDEGNSVTDTVQVIMYEAPCLDASWASTDVGNVGSPGQACEADNIFTVTASGHTDWNTDDALHFVYKRLVGDGEIIARITDLDWAHPEAITGVMMRNYLDSGSPFVMGSITDAGEQRLSVREDMPGSVSHLGGDFSPNYPVWVRLTRTGTEFAVAFSEDGLSWGTPLSTQAVLADTVLIGLTSMTHDQGLSRTATIDKVTLDGNILSAAPMYVPVETCDLPAGWLTVDVGTVMVPGTVCELDGNYSVTASGWDIWLDNDAFRFVYQVLSGDGEIVARVNRLDYTDDFAKAGVMIRENLTAGSANALMYISGNGRWSFQRRVAKGGLTVSTKSEPGTITLSHWVRIVRSGNMITGYHSTDGQNWFQTDTDFIPMENDVYIGLAVTSHNDPVSTTAEFDNVAIGSNGFTSFPVEFSAFRAEAQPDRSRVKLDWATASELNNHRFVIERSVDGLLFEPIGEVLSQGNSTQTQAYTAYDDAPLVGKSYYRLKQVDLDGTFTFSDQVNVTFDPSASGSLQAYPVPIHAHGQLNVEFSLPESTTAHIQLVSMDGRVLWQEASLDVNATGTILSFNIGALSPGMYMLYVRGIEGQEHPLHQQIMVLP